MTLYWTITVNKYWALARPKPWSSRAVFRHFFTRFAGRHHSLILTYSLSTLSWECINDLQCPIRRWYCSVLVSEWQLLIAWLKYDSNVAGVWAQRCAGLQPKIELATRPVHTPRHHTHLQTYLLLRSSVRVGPRNLLQERIRVRTFVLQIVEIEVSLFLTRWRQHIVPQPNAPRDIGHRAGVETIQLAQEIQANLWRDNHCSDISTHTSRCNAALTVFNKRLRNDVELLQVLGLPLLGDLSDALIEPHAVIVHGSPGMKPLSYTIADRTACYSQVGRGRLRIGHAAALTLAKRFPHKVAVLALQHDPADYNIEVRYAN